MKQLTLAMLVAVLCATSASAQDAGPRKAAADLFACHQALLSLYYYPYLRDFGESGVSGSRIVKDRRTDELTDIILVPSTEPEGYWAYERSGERYFFPTRERRRGDLEDHYYKLQLGKRAVYVNEQLRIGMSQPLLQPTAFRDDHRSAYTTVRPGRFDEDAFREAMERDVRDTYLSKACAHYTEELNAAGEESNDAIARQGREKATRGTVAALGACEGFENVGINRAAQRELVACGLRHATPAASEERTREAQLRDRKRGADGAYLPERDPDSRRDTVRRLDP